ncbi:uncharacterized protein LOC128745985 [Sabethes cyaneus]|uniref:uncharacterized protein LOC128745985 n=1 Tax=Sabethes cyaneus TaxID=53552 RepID=UPI00237E44E8|nr:uncharacterized protein LOC128745985 [Sabethes cyaneus]
MVTIILLHSQANFTIPNRNFFSPNILQILLFDLRDAVIEAFQVADEQGGSSEQVVNDDVMQIPPGREKTSGAISNTQVIVENTNKTNCPVTGTMPKGHAVGDGVKNKPGSATSVRRNPPRNGRANRVSSCQLCDELDNEDMVQCDSCDMWYHFACVNVTAEVQYVDWNCFKCAAASNKQVAPPVENPSKGSLCQPGPPPSLRSKGGARSGKSEARRRLKLELLKIEEKKKLEQKYLDKKFEALREFGSDTASVISYCGASKESKIVQWVADTERCGEVDSGLEPEERERFVPSNLLEPAEHTAPNLRGNPDVTGCNRTVPRVVDNNPTLSDPRMSAPAPVLRGNPDVTGCNRTVSRVVDNNPTLSGPRMVTPAPKLRANPDVTECNCTVPRAVGNHPTLSDPRMFAPGQKSTPMRLSQRAPMLPPAPPVADETVCILNRSQLAARQAVSKDLPDFSGNPEDWPLFFSVFSNSTHMCGFTNEENMLRLRKCLKGRALEAVKCRLLHPSNVGGVMSTLRMLYGRPEAIVQAIVKKVRALPSPNIDRLETVVNFALTVENLVATILACEVHDFVYNASLRYELVERLPSTLKLDWAKYSRDKPNPNLLDFSSWLYSTAEDASAVMPSATDYSKSRFSKKDGFLNAHSEIEVASSKSYTVPPTTKSASVSESEKQCPVCKGACPNISKCKRFAELSYDARWAAVRECKRCRKCLRKHNGSCRQQRPCGTNGCTFLHHPLLHSDERQQARGFATDTIADRANGKTSYQNCNTHQGNSKLLFRILPVILYGPSKSVNVYAFIDDGSDISLMEQKLAEELGVTGSSKSLCLGWTGGAHRMETSSECMNLQISSCRNRKLYKLTSVHTVESLKIRPQSLQYSEMQVRYPYLAGLPVESYKNVCPQILIGVDNLSVGNIQNAREGRADEPVAVKMRIGWTVFGRCGSGSEMVQSINHHSVKVCQCNKDSDEDLHQTVKGFFSLDSLGISKPEKMLQSQEDRRAEMLLETLTKAKDGRYESGLLWKYDNVCLPDSKGMALKRWQCLDRRMKQDTVLAKAVREKIEDHVQKGYIRKLTEEEIQAEQHRVWYLPIFPEVNPNKPGKTRLVWDAAAAVHGVSLNSVLLKGPDLLTSLLSVLIQFRKYRTAVCGDIREMYHQVQIREEDQHCQRFFWKDKESDVNPSTYIVQVMTFGACCSPSTAQYVKNTHAKRFEQEYPAAVETIVKRHYVDDMLLSVERELQAIQLSKEVRMIHASAGFEIRNWTSNSPAVLHAMLETTAGEKNLSGENSVEKILGDDNDIQLHIFVDASETGYAAVAYLRFQEGNTIECALVASRTKVSPLRFLSIPRSELQAATIGVRLADTICQSLSFQVKQRMFWTDSKDVIYWLNSDHRRYTQNVAFRVSEILEGSDMREWNWIPSKLNVADEGTKWKGHPDLTSSSRWFRGPEFLWKTPDLWPISKVYIENTTEELRPHLLYHTTRVVETVINLSRFSDWRKLLRCTARVLRYVRNLKLYTQKKMRKDGPLRKDELADAECYLFRTAQAVYVDEITMLSKNQNSENPDKNIPKTSPLYHQCVFLDNSNLLRIRGRTRACPFVTRDAAQPIVLPREHTITRLLLLGFHKRFKHQNHQTILNEVRQRFRIPKLKATYNNVRKECQECKNNHAVPQPPAMSDLPSQRLAAFTRPFTYVGVDYFGPMTVTVGRRSEKRWGVLATCLTIRAIHIELAHTLTTDSCILAIRKFMARRGVPSVIFSDRGTNFQGSSKELREALKSINQEQLIKEFTTPDTEWTFIPPASPHMGGAWERMIQSVKLNLDKLKWGRLPTDEVLHSTLLEIENIINSRPLTTIPMDNDESPVLTPNHFLLGSSNGLKPLVPYNATPTMLRNSWKQPQVVANEFWRWWLRDYLPVITRRTKWFMNVKPIEVDDIVLIADPKAPRNSWPLGRVIATRPGRDGQVRSATVQTNKGIYERPAVKLAVLDVGVRDQHAFGRPSAYSRGSVSSPVDQSTPRFTATT